MINILKIFGCRTKNSKGIGIWDGAFIFVKYKKNNTDKMKIVFFIDYRDYISKINNENKALIIYNSLINNEWEKMSKQDIIFTSGIDLSNYDY